MTPQDKLDFIFRNTPWSLGDIAMKFPCHVNTIKNIRAGKTVLPVYERKLDDLYQAAIKIAEIANNV